MEDLRVVEFGTYYAAPLVARYLAGMGCHVTSVERPVHARGALEERMRMKEIHEEVRSLHSKRVCLDLSTPEGKARAEKLVRECDILVENYAPGVMQRLGFGREACRSWNESIIYVSLPGFADDGSHSGLRAYEGILLASAGVFRNMGLNRTLLGVAASYTHLPLASVYGSFMALFATLGAVFGGADRDVIVPLASALSETMVHNSLRFAMDACYMNPRQRHMHSHPGETVTPLQLQQLFCPFFRVYWCADSKPLYLVCPAHRLHQRRALRVLQVEEEVMKLIDVVDPYHSGPLTGLGTGSLSPEQSRAVHCILKRAFLRRKASEWETLLGAAQVPACACRTTEEWKRGEHARESGLVSPEGHVASPAWLCDARQVEDATRNEPGKEERQAASPPPPPPYPLSGIKVVDMCNVIAGPTMGLYLSQLGAEVIKVDPPKPNYSPEVTVFYGLPCNMGKRSVLLDVARPEGRAVLDSMLREADVLLINCTASSLQRMRLTREDLAKVNPRLVLCRFDAWGGPREGQGFLSHFVGYDDCVQSGIGIMHRFGGGSPEEHAHIGTIDHIAGVAGASSVVAALIQRKRKGIVCTARASLASVGQYLQIPFMVEGCERLSLGNGITCVGEHSWYAAHPCANGWIFVATNQCCDVCLDPPDVQGCTVEEACDKVRASSPCAEAVPLVSLDDVRRRFVVDQREVGPNAPTFQFLHHLDHPIGSLMMVAWHCLRGIRTAELAHSPKYGSDTQSVLRRHCTRPHHHVTKLFLTRVASGGWSRMYVPFSRPCDNCRVRGRHLAILTPCDHAVCSQCTPTRRRCAVCRAPTAREVELRAWTEWRNRYCDWRRGKAKGAKGECIPGEEGEGDGGPRHAPSSSSRSLRSVRRRSASCPPLLSRTSLHGTRSTSTTSLT